MKNLTSLPLPERLACFRSLSTDIGFMITMRELMLSSMNGYPVPSNVMARLYNYLDLSSLYNLKKGLIKIRDISFFAAEILDVMPGLKTHNHQLKHEDILAYITLNQSNLGFGHLTPDDVLLATYLILASEPMDASWMLDMTESPHDNQVIMFHALYQAIGSASQAPGYSKKKFEMEPIVEGEYVPVRLSSDDSTLESVGNSVAARILTSQDEKRARGGKAEYDNMISKTLQLEHQIGRIADIYFLDHMLSVMTDPIVWTKFITPRMAKQDSVQNTERAVGLKLLATYCHSLVLLPHVFRVELFKQSYEKIQKWVGIGAYEPDELVFQYDKLIKQNDVFNVSGVVSSLLDAADTAQDKVINSEISSHISEFGVPLGFDDAIATSALQAGQIGTIRLYAAQELKDKKFHPLLLSQPIAKTRLALGISNIIANNAAYRSNMMENITSMAPHIGRMLSPRFRDPIRDMQFKPPFPFAAHQSQVPAADIATSLRVNGGTFFYRPFTPFKSSVNEEKLSTELLLVFEQARNFIPKLNGGVIIDSDMAKQLRGLGGKEWKSLMPSSMVAGSRLYNISALSRSKRDLEQLLEYLSSTHFRMIERTLGASYIQETWATYLSSFALLFEKELEHPSSDKRNRSADQFSLIPGYGSPYGLSYEDLLSAQGYDSAADFIAITDTIYIALLRKVPLPSHEMIISKMSLDRLNYAFKGKTWIDVTDYVISDSLQHMALRPETQVGPAPAALFDREYAYANNYIVFQSSLLPQLNSERDQLEYKMHLVEKDWTLDKIKPFVRFVQLGSYFHAPDVVSITDPSSTESTTAIAGITKSIETALLSEEKNGPAARMEQTNPSLDISIDVISKKSSGAEQPKFDKKKKQTNADSE